MVTLFILAVCSLNAETLTVQALDSASRKPICGITVTLFRDTENSFESETDCQGRAVFLEAKPGVWQLRIAHAAYVDLLDLSGNGRPLAASGASPLTLELTRSAAVSGIVTNSKGEPLEGAKIIALARRFTAGALRVKAIGQSARSDDRGHYRLYGVAPGWYAVAAVPAGEPGAAVFRPAQSDFFDLAAGDERTNINFIASTSEIASVSGNIINLPQEQTPPVAGVALASIDGFATTIAGTLSASGGAFAIQDVPPGEYRLLAWTPSDGREVDGPPAPRWARAASLPITVSAGETRTDVTLQPLVDVTGHLNFQDGCGGDGKIAFHSVDGWQDVWPATTTVTGNHFRADGLPPGRYQIAVSGFGEFCRLGAVQRDGRTVMKDIITIDAKTEANLTFTASTGEISGSVMSDAEQTAALVVLSSADGEASIQTARPDSQGRYIFGKVAAGDYLVAAKRSLDSTDYLDAADFAKSGAKLIRVETGAKTTCDLKLAGK
jgi:hypothetical protein